MLGSHDDGVSNVHVRQDATGDGGVSVTLPWLLSPPRVSSSR